MPSGGDGRPWHGTYLDLSGRRLAAGEAVAMVLQHRGAAGTAVREHPRSADTRAAGTQRRCGIVRALPQ
jgi:hypothetical protein